MNHRIIARLDIKGPNLVKGIHLEGLRVLGSPQEFAKKYYKEGVDELVYIDVVASLYGRENLLDIVKKTASNVFIPICAGGGVKSLKDIRDILRSGADKVFINSAAVREPSLLKKAVKEFGSSTIVSYVSSKKRLDGNYEVYIDNARQRTHLNTFDWVEKVFDLGVGELIIESINQEGTGRGIDLYLTKKVVGSVTIPVIAAGGVGRIEHIIDTISHTRVNAVALASLLHYNYINLLNYNDNKIIEGNTDYLKYKTINNTIIPKSISSIKNELLSVGLETRIHNI